METEVVFDLPKMRKSALGTNFAILIFLPIIFMAIGMVLFCLCLFAEEKWTLPSELVWILGAFDLLICIWITKNSINYEAAQQEIFARTKNREVVVTSDGLSISLAFLIFDQAQWRAFTRPLEYLRQQGFSVESGYLKIRWTDITAFAVVRLRTRTYSCFKINCRANALNLQVRCPVYTFGNDKKKFLDLVRPHVAEITFTEVNPF